MNKKYLFAVAVIFVFSILIIYANKQKTKEKVLKEKIAQMLIVGFRGCDVDTNDDIHHLIVNDRVGGVILFDYDSPTKKYERNIKNPEQVKTLCSKLQELSKNNLLISIDQEGGRVDRLKQSYGFSPSISQRDLGKIDNEDSTRFFAKQSAKQLNSLGINLNFAPCVDLIAKENCPIIAKLDRSFSADPLVVFRHSKIIIEENKKENILSAIKHFPGHGSSLTDTHLDFTDVTKTYSEKELIPFSMLIEEGGTDIVMTSHIFNRNFDSVYPCTMSYNTLTNILRGKLHFQGVIISDDMFMGAISKNYKLKESLEKAINAGVDMFILSNNGEKYDKDIAHKAIETIYSLVKEDKISEKTIDDAYNRIKKLKTKVGLTPLF
ncbi:MAG: hypothetical protein LBM25_04070 [Bacteroidales bacterium]|jgi:beta-N-acetylhexosaminidase|nr:hypothetical protein [Bacteroidales bacterium]